MQETVSYENDVTDICLFLSWKQQKVKVVFIFLPKYSMNEKTVKKENLFHGLLFDRRRYIKYTYAIIFFSILFVKTNNRSYF